MTDPTTSDGDLDALLGAYALDALDAHDRERVEAYLERDADARAEVDDMRETAASLALLPATSLDAPTTKPSKPPSTRNRRAEKR